MKFLCPSCKAKYQIADEKVAGRSVRMKCRKCGYVIPISEIPPAPETMPPNESDLAASPVVPKAPAVPGAVPARAPEAAPRSSPLAATPPSSRGTPASTGGAAKPPSASRAAPVPKAANAEAPRRPTLTDLKPASRPGSAPGASPAPLTPAKPAVKPAGSAPHAAPAPAATSRGPVPKPAAAPSSAVVKGGVPASTRGAAPSPDPNAAAAAPSSPLAAGVALGTRTPEAPATAPGSSRGAGTSVARGAAPGSSPQAAASPPAAPAVGLAALGLAAPGVLKLEDAADEEDDATHILHGGALADAFGALVGGASGGSPQELGMPADEWFVGINEVPVGPIRLNEIRKRAMLGAITPDSMVWRDGLDAWRPLKTFPELVAVLEESMSSARASSGPLVRPAAGAPPPAAAMDADGFAAVAASGGVTGAGVVTDDLAVAGLPPARSPVLAWLAVIVALGCGVTIGFVLWSKQKPPETIVKYVEVPAKAPATAIAAAAEAQPAEAASATSGAAPKTRKSSTSSKTAVDAPADKGGGISGLKGLSALGPSGPNVTGTTSGNTSSGGGQLDAAQTQSTVARYTGSVKRSCWQPALDARDPNAPTSARVTMSITVGGTGAVQNVTSSGDPRGYPGLANCIAARVRVWQFPATGGTTTVNVPFVFAAQ